MGEMLSLGVIGLGLSWVAEKVADPITPGVAGNFAHEWCKSTLRSLGERARTGELAPNHVLLRAARRSHLRATQFAAAQYRVRLARQPEASVRHLIEWCGWLEAWLGEEIRATRSDDYRFGRQPLKAEELALLVQRADAVSLADARDAFANDVLGALQAELDQWHAEQIRPRRLMHDLPPDFVDMLAAGWTVETPPPGWIRRLVTILTRRRGRGARMVHALQQRLTDAAPGVSVTWLEAFAAFFAEELTRDPAVQAMFNGRLAAHQVNLGVADGQVLAVALGELGGRFTGEVSLLRERLDQGHAEVMNELARAADTAARNRLLLQGTADTVQRIATDVAEIRSRLPPDHRATVPWQLPPRAIEGSFSGRADLLRQLVQRLRRGEPMTYVVGPPRASARRRWPPRRCMRPSPVKDTPITTAWSTSTCTG